MTNHNFVIAILKEIPTNVLYEFAWQLSAVLLRMVVNYCYGTACDRDHANADRKHHGWVAWQPAS